MSTRTPNQDLVAFLAALAGPIPAGYLELRHRPADGGPMRQRFFDAATPNAAAVAARIFGRRGDVWVGCAPRQRRAGGKDAIERAWALWVDCDTEHAIDMLASFQPQPSMLVRSGRGLHAYWLLASPLAPAELERGNRRLAYRLGADPACAELARILRPPATFNYKYDPPVTVRLVRFTGERLDGRGVTGQLPDPPARRAGPGRAGTLDAGDDPLLAIAPAVYVETLTGQPVGRDGKVSCPLHDDRTPSLHAYPSPAQGWSCFGCRRGGSVYDLGSAVLGLDTRGRGFIELRHRLYELLLPGVEPPTGGRREPPAARRSAGPAAGVPSVSG